MSVAEMTLGNKVLIPFVFILLRSKCFFDGQIEKGLPLSMIHIS